MADEADHAQQYQEKALQHAIAAARGDLRPREEGMCQECYTESKTLRGGFCTDCREAQERRDSRYYQ